jgi:hypothetical protein
MRAPRVSVAIQGRLRIEQDDEAIPFEAHVRAHMPALAAVRIDGSISILVERRNDDADRLLVRAQGSE